MTEREKEITGVRGSDRVDLDVAVDLEFESFQGFISEYSSNISTGGMFVTSEKPPPVGTILRFSLKLKGDFKLVQGRGEVIWIRERSVGAEGPAGMGIRFLDLEESSGDLIRRMVDRHKVQGGVPFDLQGKKAGASLSSAAESAPENAPVAPPATPKVESRASLSELVSEVGSQSAGKVSEGDGDLAPEIFVPPESTMVPPPSIPTPEKLDVAEQPRSNAKKLRPGFLLSLLLAAVAGAVIFYFAQPLLPGFAVQEVEASPDGVIDLPPVAMVDGNASPPRGATPSQARSQETLPGAGEAEGKVGELPASDQPSDTAPAIGAPVGDTASEGSSQASTQAAVAGPPLTRVRLITWADDPSADGTIVTLWGDGDLREEDLVQVRLGGGGGRELIKLKGISWPFRDPVLQVDSGEVRRIRTGFHPKPEGNELHIVVDLQEPEVGLQRLERSDRKILLYFRR